MRDQIDEIPIRGIVIPDTDPRYTPKGALSYALNIRKGRSTGYGEAVINMRGNEEFEFDLPAGDNICIGVVEDKFKSSVVYFIYNSLGDHGIYRFYPYESTPRIETVFVSSVLDFQSNNLIHSGKLVDGNILYWPNARVSISGEISGLPPRKLNIEKSSLYGKILSYQIVLSDNAYSTGAVYAYSVLDIDGNILVPSTTLYTVPAGPPSRAVVINAIITGLAAASIDAVYPGVTTDGVDYLIISHQTPERVIIFTCTGGIYFHPYNHYSHSTVTGQMIELIKPVPKYPIRPFYSVDTDYHENRVYNSAFQFRYRYMFDDGEKSAWSPASYVPTNFKEWDGASGALENENTQLYNFIKLKFEDDPILSSNDWRQFITGVEICVRFSQDGIYQYIGSFLLPDLTYDLVVNFYNDSVLPAVASDEASGQASQALKNYDFVPRLSTSCEVIADESGSSFMAWAGNLERYSADKISSTITVTADSPQTPIYPGDQPGYYKCLKSGGSYKVCAIYEDDFGRQEVVELGRVRIPFTQIGTNLQYIIVSFNNYPPTWSTRYRIGLSRNQNQTRYIQLPAFSVTYWIHNPTDDTMSSTNYGAGDADFVGFDFNIYDLNEALTIRNYIFEDKDNVAIFTPQNNDRIQVLNWDVHTGLSSLDIQDYNYLIAGYSLTYPNDTVSDPAYRLTVFIKFDPSQPDFNDAGSSEGANDWILMEIYRPDTVNSPDIYYEFGDTYDIVENADPLKRTHGDPVNLFGYGDTFAAAKEFSHKFNGATVTTVTVPHVQRPSLHENSSEILNDLGRVVAFDPDMGEVFSYDQIRTTGFFVSGNKVNGLNSFRGTDYIRINKSYGQINKLVLLDQVLLAIATNKSQPIYVGRDRAIDLSGSSIVGRSSNLLTIAQELSDNLGTFNPESVQNEAGSVFAFDIKNGSIWEYNTGGGQRNISALLGYDKTIKEISGSNYDDNARIYSGIDRRFSTYFININNSRCIGYEYAEKEFRGDYNLVFTQLCSSLLTTISFKDGALWVHEKGQYCNFYGVQYDFKASPVFNQEPGSMKVLVSLAIQTNQRVFVEEVLLPEEIGYLGGMQSRIPENKFWVYEGLHRADFLRNEIDEGLEFTSIADPSERLAAALLRGAPLRGECAIITVKFVFPELLTIFHSLKVRYNKW